MSNPTSPKKTAEGAKVMATLSTSTSSFEALDPHDPQPLIKLGDVLCLQSQYRNAASIFLKAVSLSPNDATPYYHLANA